MSPCPLCGCDISSFIISLDAEFVMCSNEDCVYPFAEDTKVFRTTITVKRTPEAIASARKRKAQTAAGSAGSDAKATTKKIKPDEQQKLTPPKPTSTAGPSSTIATPPTIAGPFSAIALPAIKAPTTHAKAPSALTGVSITPAAAKVSAAPAPTNLSAVPAPTNVSAVTLTPISTPSEQLSIIDLLAIDSVLGPAVATPETTHRDATTLNDFFSSIPDYDNNNTSAVPFSTAPSNALGMFSTQVPSDSISVPATSTQISTAPTTEYTTSSATPISSPTELLPTSDLLSANSAIASNVASMITPAPTPTRATSPTDATALSDLLSSIPGFDAASQTLDLDGLPDLAFDFLPDETWTSPVTPPNHLSPIDALSSKQNPDVSANSLEDLLFSNDFDIAFSDDYGAMLEDVLQSQAQN
ncbi:hypothetical protein BGX23_009397 [Mortierella sp. AD031]|nr:hypothetical protein BGX23_009397 [Mortierella sp. AD031]KAG0202975.1 hypothetical protein BGX33_009369 [Mortierella sp. NVP41]